MTHDGGGKFAGLHFRGLVKRSKRGQPRTPSTDPSNVREAVKEVELVRDILIEETGRKRGSTAFAIAKVAEWRQLSENTIHRLLNRPKKDRRRS